MKLLRVFLSLAIFAQFSLLGSAARAGSVSIQSDSISQLEANIQSLGNMQFGKARAEITDNRMSILFTVVDLSTGRLQEEKSLTGIVLFSQTTGQSTDRTLTGGVYFDGGRKLFELLTDEVEFVKTIGGQKVTGKITQVGRDQLSVETTHGTEEFLISELREIHSPRFFQFSIPVAQATGSEATFTGQAEEMTFKTASEIATVKPVIASDQPAKTDKHHMSKKDKVVSLVILGCVVATAIAVPIAVACGTSGGGDNRRQQTLQAFAWQRFLSAGR